MNVYRNNKGSLKIDKRKSSSMISRDVFLERINQEGFSFSIDIPRRNFSDFTSLVRRRRISEEDLYQLFYNYCQELENCLKEAGDKRRLLFNKFPVSPVHDKYKTKFDMKKIFIAAIKFYSYSCMRGKCNTNCWAAHRWSS